MSKVAIDALESALAAFDGPSFQIRDVRDDLARALASLRQQQPTFDDLEVFRRINAAVAKHGSIAAAARHFGVHKQSLHAVLNADRACPQPVLRGIGLRRVQSGRPRYEEVE